MNIMLDKAKVLIIDDSMINISIVEESIFDICDFFSAKDGIEGIDLAKKIMPDIILLDIMMPGISGYEVCETLKKDPTTKDIPIIFITSINESEFEEKGLALGAIDYITKPINSAIVRLRIQNHIELKKSRDMLKQLSTIDGLTQVHNRRSFDETINIEWLRMIRNKQSLSLIMIDIDYFKLYNDAYGHQKGDDCLKNVAQALKSSIKRSSDFVARYGGEEFVIILPDTGEQFAKQCSNIIKENIKNLNILHEKSSVDKYVTLSMGIATTMPSSDNSFVALIKEADDNLYKAKELGRNQAIASIINK